MARTRKQQELEQPPNLIMEKSEANQRLEKQINKGKMLKEQQIHSLDELEREQTEYRQWNEYNYELLSRMFDNRSIEEEYSRCNVMPFAVIASWDNQPRLGDEIKEFRENITAKLVKLDSIKTRLELIPVASSVSNDLGEASKYAHTAETSQKIFVVYGHDETAKLKVSTFLTKLQLNFTLLDDVPNKGRTIIEKFEQTVTDVGYAIVLLTADDIGGTKDMKYDSLSLRARQNAIFELGYFIGKLGRSQVCALYDDIELPSDYQGVLYIKLDNSSWELKLAKEMYQAGIKLDANKLL